MLAQHFSDQQESGLLHEVAQALLTRSLLEGLQELLQLLFHLGFVGAFVLALLE